MKLPEKYYEKLQSADNAQYPSLKEKELLAYANSLNNHYDVYLKSPEGKFRFTKDGRLLVTVRYTGNYNKDPKQYYTVCLEEAKTSKISPINISSIREHGKFLDIHNKDKDLYNDIRAVLIVLFEDNFNKVPRETSLEIKTNDSI